MHVHLHINGSSVMLCDLYPESGQPIQSPQGFHLMLDVDDIDAWWQSAAVREVLDRFKHRYCRLPDDLVGRVAEAVREVMITADETAPQ